MLAWLTELEETRKYVHQFIKGCDELKQNPHKEKHGSRYPKKELLSSWSLGPGSMACESIIVLPAWKLANNKPKKLSSEVFMEASVHNHDY